MARFGTPIRALLAVGLIAAGASVGASIVAPGVGHADVPVSFSANLHCTAGITDDITVFNLTADAMVVKVSLVTSLQTSAHTLNLPANGSALASFPLAIGERLDKVVLRDVDDVVLWQGFFGTVITGTGDCYREAFDLFELTAYSLTCADGVTHASVSIENRGDYAREVTAHADAWFADSQLYSDALSAGLIFPDSETLMLTPGATRVFNLDVKVVDAFELHVDRPGEAIFTDGPRIPVDGEGCGAATEVIDSSTTSSTTPTTVADSTSDSTPDSLPDTTEGQIDSEVPGQTTLPVTTILAPVPRSLPVTGRGSLPVGIVASLLLTGGLALVRTTRRGVR